jgi:hypothetical protein
MSNTSDNNSSSWFDWFGNGEKTKNDVVSAVTGAASAVTGAASDAVAGVGSMFSPETPIYTGGRRRKSRRARRARKGKRSKTARRRKSRGKHALPTSHPLHEQTRRLAMGQARAKAKSLALAGGVHAYSSDELSSMQPAYVNSKQGSFLLAGGKTKKCRKGKKAKKGGQFWT